MNPRSKSRRSIARCRRRTQHSCPWTRWARRTRSESRYARFCPSTRPEMRARSGQNFAARNSGGGGSRGRFKPVLSGVEGNPQPERPSSRRGERAQDFATPILPFDSPKMRARSGQNFAARNSGGGGSRTPVREALQPEDYMLSPFRLVSPTTLRAGKTRRRLVR